MTANEIRQTMRQMLEDWQDPRVRAAALAALWAQQIGLPAGNMWEPAVTLNILAEWRRLGADEQAWAFVEAAYKMRLGLD